MNSSEKARELLTDAIVTWFESHTGFHVHDPDSYDDRDLLSACYGGHWIEFRADKLAEHLASALRALRDQKERDDGK